MSINQSPSASASASPQPQPQLSQEPTGVSSDSRHGGQAASSSSQHPEKFGGALKASHEEIWYLKSIDFASPSGNYNGCATPCSFIAICNVLILREQIKILPSDRTSVSYEFLAQLIGEHILLAAPGVDVFATLLMTPLITKGMDPLFFHLSSHRIPPCHHRRGARLFASAGITLAHGWIVDHESPEYAAVSRVKNYDSAVNLIVEVDVLTRALLVGTGVVQDGDSEGPRKTGPSNSIIHLTDEERKRIEDAVAIRALLDNRRSQVTYTGLFTLASLSTKSGASPNPPPPLTPAHFHQPTRLLPLLLYLPHLLSLTQSHPELFALFRNSHLAVLYRHAGALYTLAKCSYSSRAWSGRGSRMSTRAGPYSSTVPLNVLRPSAVTGQVGHHHQRHWERLVRRSESPYHGYAADNMILQNAEDEWAQREYMRREQERAAQRRKELVEYDERRLLRQDEE
ncbi:hypothetical protein BC826DRAFT_1045648 [Russula brevipes]|nr:hypothetical protein BC826DRAFT_1045648 [Russula brevipes]